MLRVGEEIVSGRHWKQSASFALLLAFSLGAVGCNKPSGSNSAATGEPAIEQTTQSEAGEPSAENPEMSGDAAATPAAEQPRQPNLVKRRTSEVLHKQKAMSENPKLVQVENKVNASDPLTSSLQGYISISSRANVLNFQHQLNLMKAMNESGKAPTHAEVLQLLQQTQMDFNALPDYQFYAYDEETGTFLILEDTEAKEKFFNQK